MSYLVIARKWRPQSFSDIAGQEHITRTLQNAIGAGRIAHAYLFTGVRGVGKTTAARVLAKALNCDQGPTAAPCNQCTHCKEIAQGSAVDVLEIDGASNRGIDEIRQIIENVRYQPANSRFKIYIIDEVHQVTKDAFNALLKTLEEPPPSVKFILATTEPHRLPPTILSRCQRYDFRRIQLREIVQRLALIAKEERLSLTEGALVLLAREADGSMRDAQSLLEQVLAMAGPSGEKIDEALIQEVLGLAGRRVLYEISAAVIAGDGRRCLDLVAGVVDGGRDVNRLSRDLVEHFRNLLVARLTSDKAAGRAGSDSQLLDLPDQEIADLVQQAQPVSIDTLLDYFDFMAAGDEAIGRAAIPRFALESVLVRLAALPQTLPVSQLLERLERLQGNVPARADAASRPAKEKMEGLPGGAEAAPAAPAQRPSRSYADAEQAESASRAQPPLAENAPGGWLDFVAAVGRGKKFLASHLENVQPLELPPGRLRLGVGERHRLAFLLDGDNLASLREEANRFFGQEVNVQIVNMVAEAGEVRDPAAGAQSDNRSPMVNEALRIFGGSVRSVRRE